MTDVQCIYQTNAILGESPSWCKATKTLYWVDVKKPSINQFNPNTGHNTEWILDQFIGCVAPIPDEPTLLRVAVEKGFGFFDTQSSVLTVDHNPEEHLPLNRFNDGKFDPYGNFWAGTMDNSEKNEKAGSFYMLDKDGNCHTMDSGYHVTNGPAFDLTNQCVYLTDSARQTIYKAKYAGGGEIHNKKIFKQFGDGDSYPDGMTLDAQGNLWIAFWDGWCVRCIGPNGEILKEIKMPVPRPTSVCFDPSWKTLYVTSASIDMEETEINNAPLSGSLFSINLL